MNGYASPPCLLTPCRCGRGCQRGANNDLRTLDEPTDTNRKAVRLAVATFLAGHNSILTHGGNDEQAQVDRCYRIADMLIAKSGL